MTTGDRWLQGLSLSMVGHIAVTVSTAGAARLWWLSLSILAQLIWGCMLFAESEMGKRFMSKWGVKP
jgi:hypothetical protein